MLRRKAKSPQTAVVYVRVSTLISNKSKKKRVRPHYGEDTSILRFKKNPKKTPTPPKKNHSLLNRKNSNGGTPTKPHKKKHTKKGGKAQGMGLEVESDPANHQKLHLQKSCERAPEGTNE